MSLRGTWRTIKQNVPTPAWVRLPGHQRFCCCCSIRTGASVIGWFNFIFNSLYIGMLLLTITDIRNIASDIKKQSTRLNDEMSRVYRAIGEDDASHNNEMPNTTLAEDYTMGLDENGTDIDDALQSEHNETIAITPPTNYTSTLNQTDAADGAPLTTETLVVTLPDDDNPSEFTPVTVNGMDPEYLDRVNAVIDFTLPIMYKSICIPGLIIIFSILWLITVESRKLMYVRLFGRAFILSIFIQLVAQLGFLIYVEIKVKEFYNAHTSVVVWIVFAVYAMLNIYFMPILSEFIRRRIRECDQGMEQGLLTSEMNPRARVAEEYIQDAFTVEPDTDMVQFEASLVRSNSSESSK